MPDAPGTHRRAARAAAFALCALACVLGLTLAPGCRKDPKPAPPAEDAAERAKSAAVLAHKANVTAVPEKYELLKRLTAVYDDTPSGQDAYLQLVTLLVRDATPQTQEALRYARLMRDRHPTDPRVGEAFLQVADTAYRLKDDATRKTALEDWSKHLEARDVAGDAEKAPLYYDFVRLRLRQERWKDADVMIATALEQEDLRPEDRVELLVRRGNLLADKLGDVSGGRAAFQKALELAKGLRNPNGGPRGIPSEQIEAEIKKLDSR